MTTEDRPAGITASELSDNGTVLGAFYQAANQALDTLLWLSSLHEKTNLKSDILLLERAIRMADEAAASGSSASSGDTQSVNEDGLPIRKCNATEAPHAGHEFQMGTLAGRWTTYACPGWPGPSAVQDDDYRPSGTKNPNFRIPKEDCACGGGMLGCVGYEHTLARCGPPMADPHWASKISRALKQAQSGRSRPLEEYLNEPEGV